MSVPHPGTTAAGALQSRPWTIEPELPPDARDAAEPAVRAALRELKVEAEQHATEARTEIEALSTLLVAEASAQTDHAAAIRRLAAAEQTVLDCDAAIARLNQGTYGWCVRCSEVIPAGRLELRPHSAYCVTCTTRT
jgi:DnaK suppressor protein